MKSEVLPFECGVMPCGAVDRRELVAVIRRAVYETGAAMIALGGDRRTSQETLDTFWIATDALSDFLDRVGEEGGGPWAN